METGTWNAGVRLGTLLSLHWLCHQKTFAAAARPELERQTNDCKHGDRLDDFDDITGDGSLPLHAMERIGDRPRCQYRRAGHATACAGPGPGSANTRTASTPCVTDASGEARIGAAADGPLQPRVIPFTARDLWPAPSHRSTRCETRTELTLLAHPPITVRPSRRPPASQCQ